MAESIGTARLTLTVDTAEFDSRVDAAMRKQSGLGDAADAAYSKAVGGARRASDSLIAFVRNQNLSTEQQRLLNAAVRGVPVEVINAARAAMEGNAAAITDAAAAANRLAVAQQSQAQAAREANAAQANRTNFIKDLQSQVTAIGKTKSELLELKAAELGVSSSAAPLIKALRDQEKAANGASAAFDKNGLSVKQYNAAMRGVPAQITDIMVSLQGGQRPLTVLLQQGGQLKDMFGGIVPAARALATGLMGLVNPYTIVGAGLAGLGVAWYQGEKEMRMFERALISTGQNSAGLSAKMNDLAASLDSLKGVTRGGAADALTQIAASGVIAAENFELVSTAALKMQAASGKAVADTVAEFANLAKDPVNAILELNRAQNFLTEEQLRSIRVAQEQGRVQEAGSIATQAYANTLISRSADMSQNLGLLEKSWKGVKNAASEAWDAMLSVGRANTTAESVKQIQDMIDSMERTSGVMYASPAAKASRDQTLANLRKQLADLQGTTAKVGQATTGQAAAIDSEAAKQLQSIIDGNRSREETQKLEETRIRNLAKAAGRESEVEALIAASQKKYKDSLPKGPSGVPLANAETSAGLQAIKDSAQAEASAIQNGTRLLQAQYSARLVSANDYYAQQRDLTQRDVELQASTLQKQIDFLKSRNVSGKESVTVNKQIGELEAQLAKVRADSATALAVLNIQEDENRKRRDLSIKSYKESLDASLDATRQSNAASVMRITLSAKEAEQQLAIAAIEEQVADKRRELARELAETNDTELYDSRLSDLQDYMTQQVALVREGYAQMDEAQKNWLNGFSVGVQDWLNDASKIAEQTATMTKSAIDTSTSAIKEGLTTGKADVKAYLADLLDMVLDFMLKQAVASFLANFASSGAGNAGGLSDLYGAGSMSYFANGGVPSSDSNISKHSGTVVTKPTYFASGGNVMGEAGPEGIFPLKRGPDGKLGVSVMGSGGTGGSGPVQLSMSIVVQGNGAATSETQGDQSYDAREFLKEMANVAQDQIARSTMPRGHLYNLGVRAG